MDEKTIELYNDSFERCVAQPGFLERLYELFLNSSPEVAEKFKNTDLKKQFIVVKKSLYTLTMAATETDVTRAELHRLGNTHGREGMKIASHLYDLWLQCLLQSVREFDHGWTPDIEASWRRMLEPHIAVLKRFS